MQTGFPSLPSLSQIRQSVTETIGQAQEGLRDLGDAAVDRARSLAQDGADIGRRAVDTVRNFDVREAASTVRGGISSAAESGRQGINDGVRWAGGQVHRGAEYARSQVSGDDVVSRTVRGAITSVETNTRTQIGFVGGVTSEVVGLAETVGQLGTTAVEARFSAEARAEYGQRIVDGATSAVTATGNYARSVIDNPSRVVSDLGDAAQAGRQMVSDGYERYAQAIREGHGPETIGMDLGRVATYVVPIGGGPVRGAATAAVRETTEVIAREGTEALVREGSEALVREGGEAAVREGGEAAARGGAAEGAVTAGRTVEQLSGPLRSTVSTELAALRAGGASNKSIGPAISAVADRRTGQISQVFTNNARGDLPAALNPQLAGRLDGARQLDYIKTHGAGSHAEVYAVNQMLNQGSRIEDLVVYTQQVGGRFAGEVKPPCPHCAALLEGVTYAQ